MTDAVVISFGDIKGKLQRFEPKLGDVFVITIPSELSPEETKRIQSEWLKYFPDNDVKVAVLTDGAKVELVAAESKS